MSRFIVLEGLDGSGKSTAAALLADRLAGRLMTTPSRELRKVRETVIEDFEDCLIAQKAFYLATLAGASARRAKSAGIPHVLDRYFLSTMVYFEQRGAPIRWAELEEALLPADDTIFLDLPLEVRRARLELRGAGKADRETMEPSVDRALRKGYLSWARHPLVGRFHHVRLTGGETPTDVVERVMSRLAMGSSSPLEPLS